MTRIVRRRNLGLNNEEYLVRDLLFLFLWSLLVSLCMNFVLKWPTATALNVPSNQINDDANDTAAINGKINVHDKKFPHEVEFFYSYLKAMSVNLTPKSEKEIDETLEEVSSSKGFFNSTKSDVTAILPIPAKSQPGNGSIIPDDSKFSTSSNSVDKELNSFADHRIEFSGHELSLGKNKISKKRIPLVTDFMGKRKNRDKKSNIKHVLKVTYDFIHPRVQTPRSTFVKTEKRDSDFHSKSESLRIEPENFVNVAPSVNYKYDDVSLYETDHVNSFHKRNENPLSNASAPETSSAQILTPDAASVELMAGTTGEEISSNHSSDVVNTTMEGKIIPNDMSKAAAVNNISKEKPRSSDPDADLLHLTTGKFDVNDPSLVTIPPGQFDTMDFDVPGEPLTPEDYENAALQDDEPVDTSKQVDPTTTAEQFEGDIRLVEDDKPINKSALEGLPTFRSGIVSSERLWPNGNVPYLLSSTFRDEERTIIAKAIKTLHDQSCVRFVPHSNERDYIHFLKGDGCTSNIGRVGGSQAVSLGPGCFRAGVVMHELMHALGFWHEQSRYDRDRYININWDNIQKGKGYNFQKYDFKGLQHVGTQYDFESLMHYSPFAFAKNRSLPTVEPKTGQHAVGQRRGLSSNDLQRLMELYPCPNATAPANFPNVHLPTATLPPPVPGLCLDTDRHCASWAQMGQCTENPAWMMLHCRQSCHRCADSKCVDLNEKCADWRATGQCELNAPYMHLYCMKSCQLCAGSETGKTQECTNSNKKCGLWASQGDCVRYPGYMNRYCRKSCVQC